VASVGERDTTRLERTLDGVRDSLEVIACALSIGLQVRLLGGGVIEGDVRQAADRRLQKILDRTPAPCGE
jgi:hypothetical protein